MSLGTGEHPGRSCGPIVVAAEVVVAVVAEDVPVADALRCSAPGPKPNPAGDEVDDRRGSPDTQLVRRPREGRVRAEAVGVRLVRAEVVVAVVAEDVPVADALRCSA